VTENTLNFEKSFLKQRDKLIKSGAITLKQVSDTIELYKTDKNNPKLYYHSICCKRDKHRMSIAVVGTNQKYKILFSEYEALSNFIFIGTHAKYDRLNKDC
jgi:hypothetical protein